jgi:hypothetical protein
LEVKIKIWKSRAHEEWGEIWTSQACGLAPQGYSPWTSRGVGPTTTPPTTRFRESVRVLAAAATCRTSLEAKPATRHGSFASNADSMEANEP